MLDRDNRVVFIHLPKTAGSSLTAMLWPDTHPEAPAGENIFIEGKHWRAEKYADILGDEWDTYFRFSFVRNPWARCWSLYRWHLHTLSLRQRLTRRKLWSFKNFLRRHREQSQCTQLSVHGKIDLDYIGRHENLASDIEAIVERLRVHAPQLAARFTGDVPRRNVLGTDHYSMHYDAEAKQIVENRYGDDIEFFGYEFEQRDGGSV